MYGLSINEIKRICPHAQFVEISHGSFQHFTNFLKTTTITTTQVLNIKLNISPVENQNDLELDFKVFFFVDSCC